MARSRFEIMDDWRDDVIGEAGLATAFAARIAQLRQRAEQGLDLFAGEETHTPHGMFPTRPTTPTNTEKPKMQSLPQPTKHQVSTVDDALDLLTNEPDRVASEVDQRIEELTRQLSRLKRLKKMLGGGATKRTERAQRADRCQPGGSTDERYQRIVGYLKKNGPSRAGDIATALQLSPQGVAAVLRMGGEAELGEDKRWKLEDVTR